MRPFEEWVMQPVTPPNQLPELPEGLWEDKNGNLLATCRACDCSYHYDGEPEEFGQDMSYCGKSPRCCP